MESSAKFQQGTSPLSDLNSFVLVFVAMSAMVKAADPASRFGKGRGWY
jgi:hypothetical protein